MRHAPLTLLLVTTAAAGYTYRINDLSNLRLQGAYTLRDDDSLANVSISYSHAVTENWALNTGYLHSLTEDGDTSADSPTVFFGFGRRFELPF